MPARAEAIPPRTKTICIALLVLLGFILGCSEFVVLGVESQLAEALGVPLSRVGELVSSFALSYAVMTPVLALATGRFERYPLLITYVILFTVGNLVCFLATDFAVMIIGRVLLGAIAGSLLAVGITFIPELVPANRVSMTVAVVYAAFSVALVMSTALGKMIAEAAGMRATMLAVLVVGIVAGAALIAFMPRTGSCDEPATLGDQLPLLADPRILSGAAIFVFGVGAIYVFFGYITPYLEDILGMDPIGASTMLMVFGLICLVSNLLGGWVDSRFGLKALLVDFALITVVLLALYLVGSRMPAALIVICLIALLMCIVSPPVVSHFLKVANTTYPKALVLASSMEPTSYNVGIALGTTVAGALAAGPGLRYAGLAGAGLAIIALGAVALTIHLNQRTSA